MNASLKTALAIVAVAISTQAAADVKFFENENFQGRSFSAKAQVTDLKSIGFNDRASSVVVLNDRWEACSNAKFGGKCLVLRPGRYPSLASIGLNDRISSVRIIKKNVRISENRYAPAPAALYNGRRRNDERLYQAKVTSVRAVVGANEQQCWIEREQISQTQGNASVPQSIAAILGYQTDAATPVYQNVQRCASVPSTRPDHWDVTYNFRGQEHRMQMTSPPGTTVSVNRQGEPRA